MKILAIAYVLNKGDKPQAGVLIEPHNGEILILDKNGKRIEVVDSYEWQQYNLCLDILPILESIEQKLKQ